MKKYMVIMRTEDGQDAFFTDEYTKAMNIKMDVECGLGGVAQLYGLTFDDEAGISSYVFLEE